MEKGAMMLVDRPWWLHRFCNAGVTTYKVDHEATHSGGGYQESLPTTGSGWEPIRSAELALGYGTAPPDDCDWYIHRVGATGTQDRWYEINHVTNSPGTTHCPSSGSGYTTLLAIAENERLSKLDIKPTDGTCA
jgi:hypothetical protein